MTRKFVYTQPFRACWKAMGLSDSDLPALEEALLDDPRLGDVIEGTGGARKMRIRLQGRGKSGGGDFCQKAVAARCERDGGARRPGHDPAGLCRGLGRVLPDSGGVGERQEHTDPHGKEADLLDPGGQLPGAEAGMTQAPPARDRAGGAFSARRSSAGRFLW